MNSAESYIIRLLNRFPSWFYYNGGAPRGEIHWDVDTFMSLMPHKSAGERHVALFIANVWNPVYAAEKGWHFNAIEAVTTWDAAHRQAFISWCHNPHLP